MGSFNYETWTLSIGAYDSETQRISKTFWNYTIFFSFNCIYIRFSFTAVIVFTKYICYELLICAIFMQHLAIRLENGEVTVGRTNLYK